MRVIIVRLTISCIAAFMLASQVFSEADNQALAFLAYFSIVVWVYILFVAGAHEDLKLKRNYLIVACTLSFVAPLLAAVAMSVPLERGVIGSSVVFVIFTTAIAIGIFKGKYSQL